MTMMMMMTMMMTTMMVLLLLLLLLQRPVIRGLIFGFMLRHFSWQVVAGSWVFTGLLSLTLATSGGLFTHILYVQSYHPPPPSPQATLPIISSRASVRRLDRAESPVVLITAIMISLLATCVRPPASTPQVKASHEPRVNGAHHHMGSFTEQGALPCLPPPGRFTPLLSRRLCHPMLRRATGRPGGMVGTHCLWNREATHQSHACTQAGK